MTEVSFSRFFRQITGQTFSDYLITLRLDHASRLLVDSRLPVAEVCFQCGFNNLSNFNRIFKPHLQEEQTLFAQGVPGELPQAESHRLDASRSTVRNSHIVLPKFNFDKKVLELDKIVLLFPGKPAYLCSCRKGKMIYI